MTFFWLDQNQIFLMFWKKNELIKYIHPALFSQQGQILHIV